MSGKKAIGNLIFLLLIFGLTIYGVFHGQDLGELLEVIRGVKVIWLLPGILLVFLFIWGESIIIWYMMGTFQIHLKKRICFLFSSVGFFFSCITPSASGGQPMQIYFMKKEKIPIPVATVILMIVTITYKLVLVVIGLGILIFGQDFLHTYLEGILPVYYLGVGLNVICVGAMSVLVFHPSLTENILTGGIHVLVHMRFLKHKEERKQKLADSMEHYRETAAYLKDHKMVIIKVFLITFFQRIALFAVTWTIYKAFRLSGFDFWTVVLLQAVISVSVDMLPLPGGMGISESLFLRIFVPVFGTVTLPAMVLARGLSYYSQLLISAVFTVVAQLRITYLQGRYKST